MPTDFFDLVVQMPILKPKSKAPPPPKWQKLTCEEHAKRLANHEGNIGYRLDEICVIDPDNAAAVSRLSELEAKGELPLTVTSLTWQGRPHRFYRLPASPIKPLDINRDGIRCELRTASTQYVLAPPSVVQKDGRSGKYRWMNGRGPADIELATLPIELYHKLAKAAEHHKPNKPQGAPPAPLTEGNRNSRLCSIAGALRRQGLSPPTIEQTLLKVNDEQCDPPLEQAEVKKIASSVGRYAPASTLTADGAADVLDPKLKMSLFRRVPRWETI